MVDLRCQPDNLAELRLRVEPILKKLRKTKDGPALAEAWSAYQVAHCQSLQASALAAIVESLTEAAAEELAPFIRKVRRFFLDMGDPDNPILLEHGCYTEPTHLPYDLWVTAKTILVANQDYVGTPERLPKAILIGLRKHYEELDKRRTESELAEEELKIFTAAEGEAASRLFALLESK